jgi:hypothetical protein
VPMSITLIGVMASWAISGKVGSGVRQGRFIPGAIAAPRDPHLAFCHPLPEGEGSNLAFSHRSPSGAQVPGGRMSGGAIENDTALKNPAI